MCSTTLNGPSQPSVQSVSYVNYNELVLTLNLSSSATEWCNYNVNFNTQENHFTSNTLGSVPTQVSGDHQIGDVTLLFLSQNQLRIKNTATGMCLETAADGNQITQSFCISTNLNEIFSIQ